MHRNVRRRRLMRERRACLTLAAILAVATIVTTPARAQDGRHVAVSLVAETHNIVPGQPFRVALRQQIQTGWHTYWSNPGDSGLPTTIDWRLPPNFKAGPIFWPAPERFVIGPVVDYGYQDEVLLEVEIGTPSDLQVGSQVAISAHASWLVCSDTCVPEDAELAISVPIGAISEPDPQWVQAFSATHARAPAPNPFATSAIADANKFILHVATGRATRLSEIMFFPADSNVVDNDAPQSVTVDSEGLVLMLPRDRTKPAPAMLNGVLVFHDLGAQAQSAPGAIAISTPVASPSPIAFVDLGFVRALLLAVAGGFVLNLMPCVLPVLMIKAFGLLQHAHTSTRHAQRQGIAYAAGVLTSFAAIAIVLIGLRALGAEIGWGFQLQSPLFVTVMVYVLFTVGLNLSGAFAVGDRIAGLGGRLAERAGHAGSSFATGALATLVATPCTAPFMATAIGYGITQPWYKSLAVFEAVGFGLALPYLVIAFSPGVRRLLPKPGVWMLRLKQFLAFPIYGTAVWLLFVLSLEAGTEGVMAALAGVGLMAFSVWLYDSVRTSESRWRYPGIGLSALSVLARSRSRSWRAVSDRCPLRARWRRRASPGPFSQAKLDALQGEGRAIFVDVTAAWCITCQVNERVALADPTLRRAFADRGVAALRADWTRQDAAITRMIEANGRAGVPLYLYYPMPAKTGDKKPPIVLPQILTAELVLRVMEDD